MNRICTFLLLVFIAFNSYGQNPLTVSPNPAMILADTSEDKLLPTAYLKNNTETDTFKLYWRRIIDDMPRDWEPAVCDQTSCYHTKP